MWRRLLSMLFVMGLVACSDRPFPNAPAIEVPKHDEAVGDSSLFPALRELGLAPQRAVRHTDYVYVDGDIAVPVRLVDSLIRSAASQHRGDHRTMDQRAHTNSLSRFPNARSVSVNLSALVNHPALANATRQAMASLSSIPGVGVQFYEVSNGGQIRLSTYFSLDPAGCERGDSTIVACGEWPNGTSPGTTIRLNLSKSYWWQIKPVEIMIHEFMHNIGFGHIEWNGAALIPGTPTMDGQSVMRASVENIGPSLTAFDTVSLRWAHRGDGPAPATAMNSSGGTIISWPAVPGAIGYQVTRLTYETFFNCTFGCTTYEVEIRTNLGIHSGTSIVDPSRGTWGGCFSWFGTPPGWVVESVFPGGLSSPIVSRPGPKAC